VQVRSRQHVATIEVSGIPHDFDRAEIRFERVVLPRRSFELRVFIGEPDATGDAEVKDNPHYLGSQHFFGVGPGVQGNEPNGSMAADRRQLEPTEIRLNVTLGLKAFLATGPAGPQPLSLVAVDRGKELFDPGLALEGISLVIT